MNEISTELVVTFSPGAIVENSFGSFAAWWREVMKLADITPQTGDDIKKINEFKKQSEDVENRINEVLSLALKGNPEIQKLVSQLTELQNESRDLRLKLGRLAVSWLDSQKQAVIQEQVEIIASKSGEFFTGRIKKAGKVFHEIVPRLELAGKGKRTLETYQEAVEAETNVVIAEMVLLATNCNDNMSAIDATGLPALFQDSESLMMLPAEQLAAEIGRRIAEYRLQEEQLKARVERNPEKLEELKKEAAEKDNIYHLNNWGAKHKQRIERELPHADDLAELWRFCGELKAKLQAKEAERLNIPPVEDQAQPAKVAETEQPAKVASDDVQTAEMAEKKEEWEDGISFKFSVFIPGKGSESRKTATELAAKIWTIVESYGGSASVE